MKIKGKKMYPLNTRGKVAHFMAPVAASFVGMSMSMLMNFITDYSGIDAAMGKAGYAVGFGTLFLLITRIIDAVDDPVQGWLIDSSKESKFGKYRRFMVIGTFVLAVGGIMLYGMPTFVKANPLLLWSWAIAGYLLYDMGSAMSNLTAPLIQKETTDANVRAKLSVYLRLAAVLASVPAMFYATIVTMIGKDGDLGRTATRVAVILIVVCCVIQLIGVALLKEPYREKASKEHFKPINFKEIGIIIKMKDFWVHIIGLFVGGMPYTLSAAVMLYYIRWGLCADMATGEVDLVKFAALAGVYSLVALLPNFIAPFFIPLILRTFKTVERAMYSCMLMIGGGYAAIFILNMLGVMKSFPYLLFVLYFLIMLPSGVSAQFGVLITVECADYAEYESGRNMTAFTTSIYNFINRVTTAVGAVIPGALLIVVGYSVDSVTGAYAGNLADLPGMVNGLSVIMSLVPAILGGLSFLIYKSGYKITPEFREQVTTELKRRHADEVNEDEEESK